MTLVESISLIFVHWFTDSQKEMCDAQLLDYKIISSLAHVKGHRSGDFSSAGNIRICSKYISIVWDTDLRSIRWPVAGKEVFFLCFKDEVFLVGLNGLGVDSNPRQIPRVYPRAVFLPQASLDSPALSVIYDALRWLTFFRQTERAARYRVELSASSLPMDRLLQTKYILQALSERIFSLCDRS